MVECSRFAERVVDAFEKKCATNEKLKKNCLQKLVRATFERFHERANELYLSGECQAIDSPVLIGKFLSGAYMRFLSENSLDMLDVLSAILVHNPEYPDESLPIMQTEFGSLFREMEQEFIRIKEMVEVGNDFIEYLIFSLRDSMRELPSLRLLGFATMRNYGLYDLAIPEECEAVLIERAVRDEIGGRIKDVLPEDDEIFQELAEEIPDEDEMDDL